MDEPHDEFTESADEPVDLSERLLGGITSLLLALLFGSLAASAITTGLERDDLESAFCVHGSLFLTAIAVLLAFTAFRYLFSAHPDRSIYCATSTGICAVVFIAGPAFWMVAKGGLILVEPYFLLALACIRACRKSLETAPDEEPEVYS